MSLNASLDEDEVRIADLLRLLAAEKKTGALHVADGEQTTTLLFWEGNRKRGGTWVIEAVR